jgi:hypothetical protein
MYLYWRIQKDLDCLCENLIFRHPGFTRSFQKWIKKNAAALALAEGLLEKIASGIISKN